MSPLGCVVLKTDYISTSSFQSYRSSWKYLQTCFLLVIRKWVRILAVTIFEQDTSPYMLLFTQMYVVFDSHCSVKYASTELYTPHGAEKVEGLTLAQWRRMTDHNIKCLEIHIVINFAVYIKLPEPTGCIILEDLQTPHPHKQETRGLDTIQATSFFPTSLL